MHLYDDEGNAHVPFSVRDYMKYYGGGFLARLAGLYEVADQRSRNRLLEAFKDEFQRAAADVEIEGHAPEIPKRS